MNRHISGTCLLCAAKKLSLIVRADGAGTVKCQACKSTWSHQEAAVALIGAGLERTKSGRNLCLEIRGETHRNPQDERNGRCGYDHVY